MDMTHVCRCCLSEGLHKDMNFSYVWLDKEEIYYNMIKECFNINLTHVESSDRICDECIKSLRQSYQFRCQVQQSELEFLAKLDGNRTSEEFKTIQIKEEPEQGGCEDSDDAFLGISDMSYGKIKCDSDDETIAKKKSQVKRSSAEAKKTGQGVKGSVRSQKIRSLVSKLADTIDLKKECSGRAIKQEPEEKLTALLGLRGLTVRRRAAGAARAGKRQLVLKTGRAVLLPDNSIHFNSINSVVKRQIVIKRDPVSCEPKQERQITLFCRDPSRIGDEKIKHIQNLQNVLKHSNATPFKTKTLLGYACCFCSKSYPDPADLRCHTTNEHQTERLSYSNRLNSRHGASIKLDVEDLTCNMCEVKPDGLSTLREHLAKEHQIKFYNVTKDHVMQFKLKKGDTYDCAMCTSKYETFKMLHQHMNKHYSNYTCDICDASFNAKRSLTTHRRTHEEANLKCEHCDKVFGNKTKLNYHVKTKHMGARMISNCPYCDEPFRSYYQRNSHMMKVHNAEAQYKCNVCNRDFILKSLLSYHIKKNHLMERNYQCSDCGHKFFSKKSLNNHMVKHTGEKNYMCQVCHKCYGRKFTLREHMRIHNNDRRFKCDVCSMTFVQKCSLRSHLLSNHGISLPASEIKRLDESNEASKPMNIHSTSL